MQYWNSMSHILVVDDEPSICWGFEQFLTDEGHVVATAASAEEAFRRVDEQLPDAIVLDVRLPGMDGLTAIRKLRERTGNAPIIVITAHGNLDTAVKAIREGAFDYLPKPFDLDTAADTVHRALQSWRHRQLQGGMPLLDGRREQRTQGFDKSLGSATELIGVSPAMQDVFKQIALVAASDVPVLLTGESGTGKEMVARAIHRHGHRSQRPFLPVCLAALSPGLVESELFGHVKGAFTGATQNRAGLLELADGGTVLLDEIAETDPGLQVKLLRALEQREITPVGESRPRPVNVRIIAATNRSLADAIRAGRFREDLYYRLSVFRIHLPPLRERKDDIAPLAAHFLRSRSDPDAGSVRVTDEAIEVLQKRRWPGNVRELRNAIEHAAVRARGEAIRPEHLPAEEPPLAGALSADEDLAQRIAAWVTDELSGVKSDEAGKLYEQFLAVCEPPFLQAVLDHCGDHKARAAELLGMHRTTLRQKLRKHGLQANDE
jgi:DNA-binding NtrC family response regulator